MVCDLQHQDNRTHVAAARRRLSARKLQTSSDASASKSRFGVRFNVGGGFADNRAYGAGYVAGAVVCALDLCVVLKLRLMLCHVGHSSASLRI